MRVCACAWVHKSVWGERVGGYALWVLCAEGAVGGGALLLNMAKACLWVWVCASVYGLHHFPQLGVKNVSSFLGTTLPP